MPEDLSTTGTGPVIGEFARRVAATRGPLILTDQGQPTATFMPLSPEHQQAEIARAARRRRLRQG